MLSHTPHSFFYSPNPLSTSATIVSSACSSSTPSQIISISSPHFTQAPRTLSTLYALLIPLSVRNLTLQQNSAAALQNSPAGLRCSPVGLLITTFRLTISLSSSYSLSLFSTCSSLTLMTTFSAKEHPSGSFTSTGTSYSPGSL